MKSITDPDAYEAWYQTPRGRWIGDHEFILSKQLLKARKRGSLLDVGCGTGHFSRRFARLGLSVTGIDPDPEVLDFAGAQEGHVDYMQGSALQLPFPDNAFDCTIAITSLCFIDDPVRALRERWRVTRHSLMLGLLNRHSLLHRRKHGRGGYAGAGGVSHIFKPSSVGEGMGRTWYAPSRRPYARRWMTRILMLSPSTKPSETLFSGLQ